MTEHKSDFLSFISELPIADSTKAHYRYWADRIDETFPKRLNCGTLSSKSDIARVANIVTKRRFTPGHTKDIRLSLNYYVKFCAQRSKLGVTAEQDTAEAEGLFSPTTPLGARKRVLRSIALRRGQRQFRERLLVAYQKKCCISGTSTTEVLEAAHIRPYAKAGTNSIPNGLLLRSDIHVLFDLFLISVNPATGLIYCSSTMRSISPYCDLHRKRMQSPVLTRHRPDRDALKYHYDATHVKR